MEVVTQRSKASRQTHPSQRSASVEQRLAPKLGSGHASVSHTSTKITKPVVHEMPAPGKFDLMTHKPPRIDHFGYNKETHKGSELLRKFHPNVLADSGPIPSWWQEKTIRDKSHRESNSLVDGLKDKMYGTAPIGAKPANMPSRSVTMKTERAPQASPQTMSKLPEKKTRTQLLENRRKEAIPDLSYDLDGDGNVGGRDYVVARRFDQGFKNYLTEDERAKAFEALKNVSAFLKLLCYYLFIQGYEDQFVWDVEASGNRPYRLMQKRGAMIDAEDFRAVTDTYPRHPMSDIKPVCKTQTELMAHRNNLEKHDIGKKKADRDSRVAHLQKIQFKDYYQPQEYVANPKYTSITQRKSDDNKFNRARGGLNSTNIDTNPEKLEDPGIKWVTDPKKENLVSKRKADLIKELQKVEGNFETHVQGQGRIENREDCVYRLTYKGLDTLGKNRRKLKEMRV